MSAPDDRERRQADRSTHDDLVRSSFERQIDLFEGDDAVFARRAGNVEWAMPLDAASIVLDVACGAAHNAEALAPHVRQVVGLDLTPAVLEAGRRRLSNAGVTNVLLQEGDAAALPFVDASFDLVVCRASLHHFEDPARQVREMARVCREDGRVVLTDMVPVPPDARDRFDEIHGWIDPSHDRVLLPEEITSLAATHIGPVVREGLGSPTVLPLASFLTEQSDTERVLAALQHEIEGGPTSGFHPAPGPDGVEVEITTMVVHARRTAASR
ncbi:MAG TPA: class I SAM-dependent methyltransferase [Acidimicrobiia bacterium]|nr:class I SAM-dependent methyltransferase [Acidimicrobiia bacterium]